MVMKNPNLDDIIVQDSGGIIRELVPALNLMTVCFTPFHNMQKRLHLQTLITSSNNSMFVLPGPCVGYDSIGYAL